LEFLSSISISNAYTDKEEVRRYSPMGKVPALVLDNGDSLIDSAGIIDVLHERGLDPKRRLSGSGAPRLRALQLIRYRRQHLP